LDEQIASVLIALNLGYDNQLVWNVFARLLSKMNYTKASFQALNMSRVFKVKSEKREANYATTIWLKILKRAEFQALSSNQNQEVVQTLRDMIIGMNADDNEYLIHISTKEKNLLLDHTKSHPMNTEISAIQAALKKDFETKNYKLLTKRCVFYLMHLRKVFNSQTEIEEHLIEIFDLVQGPLNDSIYKSAVAFQEDCTSVYDR
jgi:hypothetical protein